jgi:hypothetical protein
MSDRLAPARSLNDDNDNGENLLDDLGRFVAPLPFPLATTGVGVDVAARVFDRVSLAVVLGPAESVAVLDTPSAAA